MKHLTTWVKHHSDTVCDAVSIFFALLIVVGVVGTLIAFTSIWFVMFEL